MDEKALLERIQELEDKCRWAEEELAELKRQLSETENESDSRMKEIRRLRAVIKDL